MFVDGRTESLYAVVHPDGEVCPTYYVLGAALQYPTG